ncbi:MAG TPA: glycosyltransferase family 4 protein [Thermoanaerobaculia bacterium]|jgi:phosphatidylinositol alpha-1,6-mannosyltransferase|nr:glycosyltransferase family 4 protein [Thermoanaerobaculia bacterium]
MKPKPRDLVFVSSGLGLDGGGRAAAGRLLASACARFARERGIGWRLLTLNGGGLPELAGDEMPARDFGGNARALALHLWRRQLARAREAYVFDLLGPARVQAFLPRPLRAPYLVPMYGIEVWRPLGWDRRRALAQATVSFAISAHTLERARPFCPGLAGTAVVPLALEDRPPEGAVDAALVGRAGRGFLLMVGRMAASERYKGHDQVLEALPRLLGLCPNARLVVAGEGDDRRRLGEKAAYLGVGAAVTFAGFTSEATLAELYRRCAALVLPSRGEGFGLVYLEAMRAARPVLAARSSAAEEIVAPGETGLLVDPDDREDLARALARLLRDAGAARRMGWAGRERWERELGIDRFRQRLKPLLARLVAG